MLSADTIRAMQATADSALPSTCTIQRATETRTPQGGTRLTWLNLAHEAPCRLDVGKAPAGEAMVNLQVWSVIEFTLYLRAAQDITAKDRVILDGVIYQVEAVIGAESWRIARRCLLSKVN